MDYVSSLEELATQNRSPSLLAIRRFVLAMFLQRMPRKIRVAFPSPSGPITSLGASDALCFDLHLIKSLGYTALATSFDSSSFSF